MPDVAEWGLDLNTLLRGKGEEPPDTSPQDIAVVWNVGETPLGIDGGVPGIELYDGRLMSMLRGMHKPYLLVAREFLPQLMETRAHLLRLGMLEPEDAPVLIPLDMNGKHHFQALADALKSDKGNEIQAVPWSNVGSIISFYWPEAADDVTSTLTTMWQSPLPAHLLVPERGVKVRELNNKVKMLRAFRDNDVKTTDFEYGYDVKSLLAAYDTLTPRLVTPECPVPKVMLKLGEAVSGVGNTKIESREQLETHLEGLSPNMKNAIQTHGALLEQFVEKEFSPGVVFRVDEDGEVKIVSISDQITDEDGCHLGNVFPSRTLMDENAHLMDEMYHAVKVYAQEAHTRGVVNFVMCLDFLITKGPDGKLVALASDPNGRKSGSTHMEAALKGATKSAKPFLDPIGAITDNNVPVADDSPFGEHTTLSLNALEAFIVSSGWDVESFRRGDSDCCAVIINFATAYTNRKAQMLFIERSRNSTLSETENCPEKRADTVMAFRNIFRERLALYCRGQAEQGLSADKNRISLEVQVA